MATLQKIRNRAGLLVAIIIGLALVAFLLGDLRPGTTFGGQNLEVAEIDGESIEYPEFQKKIEEIAEVYKMNTGNNQLDDNAWAQIREQAWQTVVREIVMGSVYEELGIDVTSDELFDMVQGNNLHPIIQQLFRDPNTGQVDRNQVLTFLKAIQDGRATAQQRAYWLYIEKQIKEERVQTKYNNLVRQGLGSTKLEAQMSIDAKNRSTNIQYINLPFSSIPDSAVSVSDKDLKTYYNEHLDDYKQDASRLIEYITFDVVASEDDDANTLKWIEETKSEFETIQDNEQYVNVNSDQRFENIYQKKEDLTAELADFAFNNEVGAVYGPYKESNAYKLVKIDDFKDLPDSVKARHILIKPETVGSYEKALAMADSLKALVEGGSNFAKLAEEHSEDVGSARKGGDLGWFKRNQMVKPFEEAAFNGEVRKLYTVTTQFGVHLIQPTRKGKEVEHVRLAILTRDIEPSTQTYQNVYAKASKFVSENQDYETFKNSVAEQKLTKKVATVTENQREIAGLEYSRTMIRSAFGADEGDILANNDGSPIFELGDSFVIGALAKVTKEGTASLDEVKPRVELAVKKQKKADALVAKIESKAEGNDLEAIASSLDTEVKDATGLTFNSFSIPGVGSEPAIIGTLASLEKDQVSAPVKGNNGVFLIKVISITEGTDEDVEAEQKRLAQSLGYRANYQAYEAQRNAVEIEDNRAKFY